MAPHVNDAQPRDAGSALIITMMVLALLTALATTVSVVTINNLQSASRAQQAGAALNAAEAGIAQAMAYLRSSGVRDLTCSPRTPATPNCAGLWGSGQPASVPVPGDIGQAYSVWIERVAPYTSTSAGLYRIHSVGTASGAASRTVTADVHVTTTTVPKGVFARTVSGGGNASVQRASIFSTGCVYNRSKIKMTGTDAAYGIPAAVHSSQIITDSNGSGQFCPTTSKPIHRTNSGANRPCNTDYNLGDVRDRRYDQDRLGGQLVSGEDCHDARMNANGAWAPYYTTRDLSVPADGIADPASRIEDDAMLLSLFGLRTPVLTQAQLDQLRTIAQSQENYYTTAAAPPSGGWSPDEANAVLFFDLAQLDPGGVVNLNNVLGFERAPEPATCPQESLIIVIEGGNAKLNSNHDLVASLFLTSPAPYGQVLKVTGNSNFIGTIYGDSVDLTGNTTVSLDSCFLDNPSPALLDLRTDNYVEWD